MTDKRYSDGKLAKWYYSQENVVSDGTNEYYLASKESIRNVDYSMLLGTNDLLDELNRLSDENEQLRTKNNAYIQDIEVFKEENTHLKLENEELKEEKEKWKSNCSLAISENSILWNEINILREQGAEPSEAFINYLNKKRSYIK